MGGEALLAPNMAFCATPPVVSLPGCDEFRWRGILEPDMRVMLSDFISLDGVVQAPGGKDEDIDGGFQHGGWSMPFFDPESMGAVIGEVMRRTEALRFGRRTWEGMAAAWPGRAGDPYADHRVASSKSTAPCSTPTRAAPAASLPA